MLIKLFLLHYIADFILQPREMGANKSTDWRWLAGHLLIQFLVFLPFTSLNFALANCAIHGIIDWYIWRAYKWSVYKRVYDQDGLPWIKGESAGVPHHSLMNDQGNEWRYWLDKVFYDVIGLDQFLHIVTIYKLSEWLL